MRSSALAFGIAVGKKSHVCAASDATISRWSFLRRSTIDANGKSIVRRTVEAMETGEKSSIMDFVANDNLTVTGNRQPLSSGSLTSVSNSTNVHISGNVL